MKRLPEPNWLKNNIQTKVSDPFLLRVEFYNPNSFDIYIALDKRYIQHIVNSGIELGKFPFILQSEKSVILPHQYIIMKASNGAPQFQLTVNMGAMIGKGNKLPSLPTFD